MIVENPAPRPGERSSQRLSYLDGVRALAALFVVAHHIWLTYFPAYPVNTGPFYLGWLVYGHLAVAVFIVVSGFSLTIAPARREFELGGVVRFLRRRAWRILPPYWAALAFSALVFGLVTPSLTGQNISAKGLVVHALLVQDVINTPKPNGAFWSIALEWQIYFLFPLVLLLWRRIGGLWSTVLLTTGVIVAQVAGERVAALDGLLHLTPQFFALFVFGVAAASVVRGTGPLPRWVPTGGLLCLAVFVVLAALLGSVWIDRNYFWIDLLVGVGTALLLAAMARGQLRPLAAVFSGRFARRVGLYSYSVYLVHMPLLWLTAHFLVDRLPGGELAHFFQLVLVGIPAVLVFSYLFHRVFELPFIEHRSFAALASRWRTGSGAAGPDVADGAPPQAVLANKPDGGRTQ